MKIRNKILLLMFVAASFVGVFFVKNWFYPPNMLLERPLKVVFTEEDRKNWDWRGGGFHAGPTVGKKK